MGHRRRPEQRKGLRYRLALTPAGAGVLTLFFPGSLVALASGQRLLVTVSVGAALVLAVNALWAGLSLGALTVDLSVPPVATVGTAVPVTLTLSRRRPPEWPLECVVGLVGGVRGWVPAEAPGLGTLAWRTSRRGVVRRLTVRLQCSVPLGLVACVRSVELPLEAPLHLAPAARRPTETFLGELAALSAVRAPQNGGSGSGTGRSDPVGLRAYRAGDASRDVHWPTVARTGALMVRARDDDDSPAELVTLVVSLEDEATADDVLGRARGVAERLLADGWQLELVTLEDDDVPSPDGPLTGPPPAPGRHRVRAVVATRAELIRRLARVAVDPTPIASGPGDGEDVLAIDGGGARWRPPA